MSNRVARIALVLAGLSVSWSSTASAQSLGTFTWQLQPFCNRVTVNVVQTGAVYTLDGYDDQCGAAQRAPLVGLATPNPDGTIGFGLHIVTVPGGADVSVEARITLAGLGGSWSDSAGNSGTFAFGGTAAGSPRPAPVSGPVWGTQLTSPAGAPSSGLRLKSAGTGTLTPPPPALVVEGVLPAAVPSSGYAGVLSTTSSGDALVGLSDSGNGVVAYTGGGTPGTAGLLATNGGRGFAILAQSNNSLPAIYASGSATSAITAQAGTNYSALELFGGGITVSGSTRPAFVHTAAAGNIIGIRTVINHPLLNGRSNAIVTASHVYDTAVGFVPGGIGVLYDTAAGRWSIFREDSLAMPVGARFNVIVFNQ